MIRPSLTLVLDLDETIASDETIQELKRSYSHIGTPVIRTHTSDSEEDKTAKASEAESQPRNTARALLKLGTKHYLKHSDEGADELWAEVMESWIGNAFHRIGNNMKVFNDRQREIGLPEVFFDSFDLVLQGGELTVAVHPTPEGLIDPALKTVITQARELYNEALIDEAREGSVDGEVGTIVLIEIPARSSYEDQKDQAWAEWVANHPEATADDAGEGDAVVGEEVGEEVEEATGDEKIAAVAATDEVGESATGASQPKTREELLAEDIIAKSYENTVVSPTNSDALPSPDKIAPVKAKDKEEQFTFAVNYSLWGVTFENGPKRLFDSEAGVFLPDSLSTQA